VWEETEFMLSSQPDALPHSPLSPTPHTQKPYELWICRNLSAIRLYCIVSDHNLHKIVNFLGCVFICSSRQKCHPFKGFQVMTVDSHIEKCLPTNGRQIGDKVNTEYLSISSDKHFLFSLWSGEWG
jgi:hypothetical protein